MKKNEVMVEFNGGLFVARFDDTKDCYVLPEDESMQVIKNRIRAEAGNIATGRITAMATVIELCRDEIGKERFDQMIKEYNAGVGK